MTDNKELVKRIARAIEKIPLCISSTRRSGENGLRNADEIAQAAFNIVKDELEKRQWQAAQQVQVSKVLELCYTSFGKMRKCDHLDQQIAESSQNMIKAALAAIQGGGK